MADRRMKSFSPGRLRAPAAPKPITVFPSSVCAESACITVDYDKVTVNGKKYQSADDQFRHFGGQVAHESDGALWLGTRANRHYTVGWGYRHSGDFFIPSKCLKADGDIAEYKDGILDRYVSRDLKTVVEYHLGYPLEGIIDGIPVSWCADGRLKRWGGETYTRKAYYLADKVGGEPVRRRIGWQSFTNGKLTNEDSRDGQLVAGVALLSNAIAACDGGKPADDLLKQVADCPHSEARRILMTRVGMHHYLSDAEVLDMDTDGQIARALLQSAKWGTYLICHDGSTGRQYSLAVGWNHGGTCASASMMLADLGSPFRTVTDDSWVAES